MLVIVTLVGLQMRASATPILGSAEGFAVLGYSTVTNTGSSVITGSVGVSPGSAVTGFPPGILAGGGTVHLSDDAARQAQADLATAYGYLSSLTATQDLSGKDLGGLTLTPGVYYFSSDAGLTGTLTLNADNAADALFVFQIGTSLATAANSSVFIENAPVGNAPGLYFVVGTSATLGAGTNFEGNILADQSISLNTGASINLGRALAVNGAVTLDTNIVSDGALTPEPRPGQCLLLGLGLAGTAALSRRLVAAHSSRAQARTSSPAPTRVQRSQKA